MLYFETTFVDKYDQKKKHREGRKYHGIIDDIVWWWESFSFWIQLKGLRRCSMKKKEDMGGVHYHLILYTNQLECFWVID